LFATGGKFAAYVIDTGGNLPCIVDTSGKFAAGIVDTGGIWPPVSLTPMTSGRQYQQH
jgi:hypothetical protein